MANVTTEPKNFLPEVSQSTGIKPKQVQAVLNLLDEGNTIPFIARYRKEATGSLDEVQINDIQQNYTYASQLHERKTEVIRLIDEQDKLTPDLKSAIEQASKLQAVEDLYRPFKQKRRTKAMIAQENGLEPLADWLQQPTSPSDHDAIENKAQEFITDDITTVEEALDGAHEIIAQKVSDNAEFREFIRKYIRYNGKLVSQVKDEDKDEQNVYQMYYDYSENYNKVLPHRVLALNRAEKEKILTVKIEVEEAPAVNYMAKRFINAELGEAKYDRVLAAIEDAYKRFIFPAIERELRNDLTETADDQAIDVFGENLRHLLLQPPLKGNVVLGFDPAYRTGCKLAVVSETGRVLDIAVIYPHKPASAKQRAEAEPQLVEMIKKFDIDVIAIGNGTASRESEQFVSDIVNKYDLDTKFVVVNEAGASVYSASKFARDEFPDLEVQERSAVSIARRLQDPLAELIKIDPKSMGVGQYQHDVSQKELSNALDFVVDITVNQVGVDINTASIQLLQRVSGLTKSTANNIIQLRDEIGQFTSRQQIKDVKRMGPKTYEQSVGFLRVLSGKNPLDQTSIHPESYPTTLQLLEDLGIALAEIGSDEATAQLNELNVGELAKTYDVGEETLSDILDGLKHPSADIRDAQPAPILRADVLTMKDLEVGMHLQGAIRNVVDFGAFVDIGVKQDGLIHISKLSDAYIKHPSDVVAIGDIVEVEVISLDLDKERIGLARLKDSEN